MKKLYRVYTFALVMLLIFSMTILSAAAVDDMWTVANKIIVDVYNKIAGITAMEPTFPMTSTLTWAMRTTAICRSDRYI